MTKQYETQTVTATVTPAIFLELERMSIAMVNRKDLASLRSLFQMGVDLDTALLQSAKLGFHDLTGAMRAMGVPVTDTIVGFAASKSPASYFSLCGPDGTPPYLGTALRVAIQEGKCSFAQELIERHRAPVTGATLDQYYYSQRLASDEFVEMLFDAVGAVPLPQDTLERIVQFASVAQVDRVLVNSPQANLSRLVAYALRAGNFSVAQEIVGRLPVISPAVLAYFEDKNYFIRHDATMTRDAESLRLLAKAGAQFSVDEMKPVVLKFIEHKRRHRSPHAQDRAIECDFLQALAAIMQPQDWQELPERIEIWKEDDHMAFAGLAENLRDQIVGDVVKMLSDFGYPETVGGFTP